MPFDTLAKVWDYFFAVGWEAMLRVAIVLLRDLRTDLLASDFEGAAKLLLSAAREKKGRKAKKLVMAAAPTIARLSVPIGEAATQQLPTESLRTNVITRTAT